MTTRNDAAHQATRGHARLGGSLAGIFTKCTGAPALWEGRSRKATSFTREGTLAHELAERAVFGDALPPVGVQHTVEGENVEVTDEILTGVRDYARLVHDLKEHASWSAIEVGFSLEALWPPGQAPESMFGSADFVAVEDATLTVLDLKFGKGVLVPAKSNAQLLYYALGAWFTLVRDYPDVAGGIEHVRVGIYQPRINLDPDWWEIALVDLLMWGDVVLKAAVDAIHSGATDLVAGDHCKFCVAKGACPALHAAAMQVAKDVFPPPAPVTLDDDQISEALDHAEALSIWLSAVRLEAEARLRSGATLPGWKLVSKKGYRKWIDPKLTLQTLRTHEAVRDTSAFMTTPELVSPAQAEKKLRALGVNTKILMPLVVTPETGLTIVAASDPRPAVDVSPSTVFTLIEDDSE